MRYLNKIVFINSANIKYAEVEVDGNVHFIGTQGVGKSTSLRAILFFYNADKLKLGIEKNKKTFDEYYFPYPNSYIVYEVARETGAFCILVQRTQGRASYRFIDGAYNRSNFIGTGGQALTWEGIRATLDKITQYSNKVDRYEEYKDILYGNTASIKPEFRKYALLESKQYQNIPRTIQNVFLNSKLDAEFIKQTIINSLNEDDVKIELDQYVHHLKDFDTQLADINKWREKNKNGEIPVLKQAEQVARLYTTIKALEREKKETAIRLFQKEYQSVAELQQLEKEIAKYQKEQQVLQGKLDDLDSKSAKRKSEILGVIAILTNKIKTAKTKEEEYQAIGIATIMARVAQKAGLELRLDEANKEKELLSAKFKEITTRYQALVQQQEQVKTGLDNQAMAQINKLKESLLTFEKNLSLQYRGVIEEIRQEHKSLADTKRQEIDQIRDTFHQLELRKQATKLKTYLANEQEEAKNTLAALKSAIEKTNFKIADQKRQKESLQKDWDQENEKNIAAIGIKAEKLQETAQLILRKIRFIDTKLEQGKDSLYSWLCCNLPGWEQTIGKVIDESEVLFQVGLSPKLVGGNGNFFGLELNLGEINKTVKTIDDYLAEKALMQNQLATQNQELELLNGQKTDDTERLKKKYQPKIKELNDAIRQGENTLDSNKYKIKELEASLVSLAQRAELQKNQVLNQLQIEIDATNAALHAETANLTASEANQQKKINQKEKELKEKISQEAANVDSEIGKIAEGLKTQVLQIKQRIEEIKQQQYQDLQDGGADTKRLGEVEVEITRIKAELDFVDKNRDKVAQYKQDKLEYFDKIADWKTEKALKETALETENEKCKLQLNKLKQDIAKVEAETHLLEKAKAEITIGQAAFSNFKQTEDYSEIEAFAEEDPIDTRKENNLPLSISLSELVDSVKNRISILKNRYNDLQAAANKFLGNFSEKNIFGFKTILTSAEEFLRFAENLIEFLEEDKIGEYENRTNEKFASLIRQIGIETTNLVSKEAEIQRVIKDINQDFTERNFAGVIKRIELSLGNSQDKIVVLLKEIKKFNDDYSMSLGAANLFSPTNSGEQNKKAIEYLKDFAKEIANRKEQAISLADSFELQFRIVENENDSGWVEKLANVGSEGTDTLVKAMINIMLLNVFKDHASKKFKDFKFETYIQNMYKFI